ncbi:MAG: GTPase HflX, partial [Myxococcota bacterium]
MRPTGNLHGLKARQLHRLEATFRRRVKGDGLVTAELARYVGDLSRELNRQVGLLIDRGGSIQDVIVGEPSRLYLPDIGRARAGQGRFRGLRLVRTELRGQGLTREDLADLTKLRLDAVLVLEIDPGGHAVHAEWAHLVPQSHERTLLPVQERFRSVHELPEDAMAIVRAAEQEMAR